MTPLEYALSEQRQQQRRIDNSVKMNIPVNNPSVLFDFGGFETAHDYVMGRHITGYYMCYGLLPARIGVEHEINLGLLIMADLQREIEIMLKECREILWRDRINES